MGVGVILRGRWLPPPLGFSKNELRNKTEAFLSHLFPRIPWQLLVGRLLRLSGHDKLYGDSQLNEGGRLRRNLPGNNSRKPGSFCDWEDMATQVRRSTTGESAGQISYRLIHTARNSVSKEPVLRWGVVGNRCNRQRDKLSTEERTAVMLEHLPGC